MYPRRMRLRCLLPAALPQHLHKRKAVQVIACRPLGLKAFKYNGTQGVRMYLQAARPW